MHRENDFSVRDSKPEGLSFLYSLFLLPPVTVFDDSTQNMIHSQSLVYSQCVDFI